MKVVGSKVCNAGAEVVDHSIFKLRTKITNAQFLMNPVRAACSPEELPPTR